MPLRHRRSESRPGIEPTSPAGSGGGFLTTGPLSEASVIKVFDLREEEDQIGWEASKQVTEENSRRHPYFWRKKPGTTDATPEAERNPEIDPSPPRPADSYRSLI